jgi:ferredoxin
MSGFASNSTAARSRPGRARPSWPWPSATGSGSRASATRTGCASTGTAARASWRSRASGSSSRPATAAPSDGMVVRSASDGPAAPSAWSWSSSSRTCPTPAIARTRSSTCGPTSWASPRAGSPPAPAPADLSHAGMTVRLDGCIQCTRCVRACREVQVNDVIGYAGRGAGVRPIFDFDDPMGESTCVACGECVQACPTGALMPRSLQHEDAILFPALADLLAPEAGNGHGGAPGNDRFDAPGRPGPRAGRCRRTSYAPRYTRDLAAQRPASRTPPPRRRKRPLRPVALSVLRRGLPGHVPREPGPDHPRLGRQGPANLGRLCVKGRFGIDYVHNRQRLTTPLIRREGVPKRGDVLVDPEDWSATFREATWEEALDAAAAGLRADPRRARRRRPGRIRLRQGEQRGGVPVPEAGAHRVRHQQRGPLHPPLPRVVRGGAAGDDRVGRRLEPLRRRAALGCLHGDRREPAGEPPRGRDVHEERHRARRPADPHRPPGARSWPASPPTRSSSGPARTWRS